MFSLELASNMLLYICINSLGKTSELQQMSKLCSLNKNGTSLFFFKFIINNVGKIISSKAKKPHKIEHTRKPILTYA